MQTLKQCPDAHTLHDLLLAVFFGSFRCKQGTHDAVLWFLSASWCASALVDAGTPGSVMVEVQQLRLSLAECIHTITDIDVCDFVHELCGWWSPIVFEGFANSCHATIMFLFCSKIISNSLISFTLQIRPLGLWGLLTMIIFVFTVIFARIWSQSGRYSSFNGIWTGFAPHNKIGDS